VTVKLDTEGIGYIGVFEHLTGAGVRDCLVNNEENKVTMVIKNGDMSIAIGKGGSNVTKVKELLKKEIELVEYSADVKEFIENLFRPAYVKSVELLTKNGQSCAYVEVFNKDKGIAIGRNGEKIRKVKELVKRNQDIDNVIIV
jgi:N utilization substance protein A